MKLFKINPLNPEKEIIEEAVRVIKNNGLVIYPTDTLYGLGANALSEFTVRKIFEVKGRDFNKPISIAVSSLNEAKKYVKLNQIALKLAKRILPGPITLILPVKKKFPKILTRGKNKIGIRVPDNKVTLELIKKCGFPLTSTSANVSGGKDSITAKDAIKQIGGKVDLVLDSGRCKYSKQSTVIEITKKEIKILREGVIKKEKILNYI
jgi:L-threonylcarbamoyladenylate synthase